MAGADDVLVAVNGTEGSEPLVAVRVLVPTVVPRVQLPTVAVPSGPVTTEPPVTPPLPSAAAKTIVIPLLGLPNVSLTITLGRADTAVPAVAD